MKVWDQSTVLPWYSRAQVPGFHLRRHGSHPTANRTPSARGRRFFFFFPCTRASY